MKMVIEIPEEDYKRIKSEVQKFSGSYRDWEEEIANGTPLPKGHGRLIDSKVLGNYFWDNRSKLFEYKDLQIAIDNTPTIIEGSDSE